METDKEDEADTSDTLRDRCFPGVETPGVRIKSLLLYRDLEELGPGVGLTLVSIARREVCMGFILAMSYGRFRGMNKVWEKSLVGS